MAAPIERIVDAHVHLWDPARADWYPYLAGQQELDMGDISGMVRRFDQPTYFSESANYNVVKFVHVAAATAGHSGEETAELEELAEATGHPDAIIGGIVPDDPIADTERLLDAADGVVPVPRHPADGRRVRRPARRRPAGARRARPGVRAHGPSRPARELGGGARRLGRAHRGRGARGLAAGRLARGVRAVEARDLGAWRLSATTSTASCRAWPCHCTRWTTTRWHRGSGTASSRSASTGACSRATSRSTRCTAPSTSSTRGFDRVTADLGADARDKLFAANAERLYRC